MLHSPRRAKTPKRAQSCGQTALVVFIPARFRFSFRLAGPLGRGGMGEVYRADDLRLGQPVALKFLPESIASDPTRLAQFHQGGANEPLFGKAFA